MLMRGVHSDVVEQEMVGFRNKHQDADNRASFLYDPYGRRADTYLVPGASCRT